MCLRGAATRAIDEVVRQVELALIPARQVRVYLRSVDRTCLYAAMPMPNRCVWEGRCGGCAHARVCVCTERRRDGVERSERGEAGMGYRVGGGAPHRARPKGWRVGGPAYPTPSPPHTGPPIRTKSWRGGAGVRLRGAPRTASTGRWASGTPPQCWSRGRAAARQGGRVARCKGCLGYSAHTIGARGRAIYFALRDER